MQNNMPTIEDITKLFAKIKETYDPGYFSVMLSNQAKDDKPLKWYFDHPQLIERLVQDNKGVSLRWHPDSFVLLDADINAFAEACTFPVTILMPNLKRLEGVNLSILNNSNVTFKTLSTTFAYVNMEYINTPNLKFETPLTDLVLIGCTFGSHVEPIDVHKLVLTKIEDFSGLSKIKVSHLVIGYKSPTHIPTNWSMFPNKIDELLIAKTWDNAKLPSSSQSSNEIVTLSSKSLNAMIAHFKSVRMLGLRTRHDKIDGPINLVSLALWNLQTFDFDNQKEDGDVYRAFDICYEFCVGNDAASLNAVVDMQEQLIEVGLADYAK